MSEILFRLKDIRRFYEGTPFLLDIPSYDFQSGRVYALVGPNGAGKTTLLRILALLDRPTEGQLLYKSLDVYGSRCDLTSLRRQITLAMQSPRLFNTSVYNNVAYGLRVRKCPRETIDLKVSQSLELVGLRGFENRSAQELSGGEAQRVSIARALCLEPEALFLDEPMSSIDTENVGVVRRLIRRINDERGATVIFTTHDMVLASCLADEVVSILAGKLVDSTPENIFRGKIEHEDGLPWFVIADKLRVAVVSDVRGESQMSIDPHDIIISHRAFHSSARNSFSGRITHIVAEDPRVRLTVDVGVDFVVLITTKSLSEMSLNVGSEVHLTFKTTAVRVF